MFNLMEPSERQSLTAHLRSGQPELVASALEILDQACRRRRFGPLPLPEPECLSAFGESVPSRVLSNYLSVLMHYPDFEPTPSLRRLRQALVEAVIRYGQGQNVHDVALFLWIDDFPADAVSDALRYLMMRGLYDPHETLAAQQLVDYLLDSPATRKATVEMLRMWALTDSLPEIIDFIWPRLDDSERAQLDVDKEDP
jgi:hypothetical protein